MLSYGVVVQFVQLKSDIFHAYAVKNHLLQMSLFHQIINVLNKNFNIKILMSIDMFSNSFKKFDK